MHRRDRTTLGLVLAILERSERTREIFINISNICELCGIVVDATYREKMPGQCHRCQLHEYAEAKYYAQPRCVKCLVPHWAKDCEHTRESGDKPSCRNYGQYHKAYYRGCLEEPKSKLVASIKKNTSKQRTEL
ncbi:hypothetical protein EVAR_48147_1 [Eumeta japonica]|uniref:Nucleic-acid-binding protein from transposon X-element n=1 Tax=Eumeta variegata TaxID=151549 RepID=A0A4C1WTG9_EUMVA|nr:hypothetical protein EVAR_48147_1 [Eumeta japonica]